ncbi:MAG: DUF5107 domain-containing protein [Faecousia sp.]
MESLTFTKIAIPCAQLGGESCLPDIMGDFNVQNRTEFRLDEDDEIYEAYGQRDNGYPYRRQDQYVRALADRQVDAAVLENQFLRAEFLPGYGGRLWRLYDKVHGRDLLYTNDCLRASNLAVRNAWFSGGVEWNCGVIGHTPFTMDRIFAARLEKDHTQVLRMYAYERIRGVVYQMDFWLDSKMPALNCHMSIANQTRDVLPMYWWSNIASPVYPGGRLLVPAGKAYSHRGSAVVKVDIPQPEPGLNISHYEDIPTQRDYFFCLDADAPRWIANVDARGRGLLHTSSRRLQSRKLFTWGYTDGAQRWQEFLTKNAGPYLEIQAGLGKTQYGCIPMAPNTTWEWSERYEPLELEERALELPFEEACRGVSRHVVCSDAISEAERFGHEILREKSERMISGSGDAALESLLRQRHGLPPLRPHLDFASEDTRQEPWREFLRTGVLPQPEESPAYDLTGALWLKEIREAVKREPQNGFGWYCLSLLENEGGREDLAKRAIARAIKLWPAPCVRYTAAVYALRDGKPKAACAQLRQGFVGTDLGYVKAGLELYAACGAWNAILRQIGQMPESIQRNSRVRFYKARALHELGKDADAMEELEADGGLELEDIRECDTTVGILWHDVQEKLTGKSQPIPHFFNFNTVQLYEDKGSQ